MTAATNEFDAYSAEVRDYASNWFLHDDAAIEAIRRSHRARAAAAALAACKKTVGTDVIYMVQPDRWTPERSNIQAGLLETVLQQSGIPTGEQSIDQDLESVLPIAVLLLGMPGSGKSSCLRPMARELCWRVDKGASQVVDADAVRGLFPEYAEGLGSEVVQVETAFMTYGSVVHETYRRKAHVVLDTIGDPDRSVREAEYLTETGWTVCCLCAQIDVETAVARAISRALSDGRYVPVDYIRSIDDRPQRAYSALKESGIPMIGLSLLDTDVSVGNAPVVVDSDNPDLFGRDGEPTTLWPTDAAEEEAS
jgi:hypothetical protein